MMTKLGGWLTAAASSRFVAYASILLLQLKVIWGVWNRKDMPFGDTASYYVLAQAWHLGAADHFVWSPLYTTFYGSFLSLSSDAYLITIAHRVVIVLALALLVLALMRSLLSPIVAWAIAVWWVVLPINFDSLYDVHLFYVVLILILYLAVLHIPGIVGRGVGTALLLAYAVLMRNELLGPLVFFAAIALCFDLRRCFKQGLTTVSRMVAAYGIPLLCATLVCTYFYAHSLYKWPELERFISTKHTLNVCQVYAFGYQQRHPEWTQSPWTDCQPLIQATFGKPEVTMWEATRLNPTAMIEHYWWNAKLIPSGLQVLLFNVSSGHTNPDYAPVKFDAPLAILASSLLIAILAGGVVIFLRHPREWYKKLIESTVWAWVVMLCVASIVVIIMIVERPRPSYMFSLGLLVMAAAGCSLEMIISRWNRSNLWPLFLVAVASLLVLEPCYYDGQQFGARPRLEVYRHIVPFRQIIDPSVAVMAPGVGAELCFYLSRITNRYCQGIDYFPFRDATPAVADWNQQLAKRRVKFFVANEAVLTDPPAAEFINTAALNGWQVAAAENIPGHRWLLLEKK
jgi:hypothetical protein